MWDDGSLGFCGGIIINELATAHFADRFSTQSTIGKWKNDECPVSRITATISGKHMDSGEPGAFAAVMSIAAAANRCKSTTSNCLHKRIGKLDKSALIELELSFYFHFKPLSRAILRNTIPRGLYKTLLRGEQFVRKLFVSGIIWKIGKTILVSKLAD